PPLSHQIEAHACRGGKVLEWTSVFVPEIKGGRIKARRLHLPAEGARNLDDALRLGIRQRPKEHAVNYAEQCCVPTNPEGQGDDSDGREARIFVQHSKGVTKVVYHG